MQPTGIYSSRSRYLRCCQCSIHYQVPPRVMLYRGAITFILIGIIFGVGWAAWRGQAWAFVALFVWEFGGVIFGGALDPFGLFIVVFSVQAYRYYRAAKQFAAMKLPNLLGSLSGLTKLTYAAAQARLYYVKHLVKSGANVDERTTTGFTPLMLAAATNKSPAVVKHLLKAGADKTMQTPDGRQAVDFARERGAYVVVSEVSPERRAISAAHCADRVIDGADGSPWSQLELDFPDGFDTVIESTGVASLIDDGIECLRFEGTFVFEGIYPDQVSFTFELAHQRQINAVFPWFIGTSEVRRKVLDRIVTGTLDFDPLITNQVSWSRADETYGRLFTEERDHLNGIVIDWRGAV